MDIICFGQQNWDFCGTGKQHLMTRLARRGHRILYVERRPAAQRLPMAQALRHLAGGGIPGLRKLVTGANGSLWIFTPQIFSAFGWHRGETCRLWHLKLAMRQLGFTAEAVLVLHPYAYPQAARLNPLGIVYYAVDDYSACGTNVSDESETRYLENRMAARAQICLSVSPRLRERYAQFHSRSYLLPDGADVDHFAPGHLERFRPHPALRDIGAPVLGFIGQVDERLDQDLLRTLALRQPNWQFALAGRIKSGLDLSRLSDLPNLRFLGYQPNEKLPSIARAVDLWLLPYRKTDLTHACNPMRVYDYLATGRPVVAVPLDGLVEGRKALRLAEGADAFQRAIRAALTNPEEGRQQRLATAERLSWGHRTEALENHLLQAVEIGAGESGRLPAMEKKTAAHRARRTLPFPAGVNEYGRLIDDWNPALLHRSGIRLSALAGALCLAGRAAIVRWRKETHAIRRILVVRRSRLGDVINILPTLAALRAAWPEAYLVLAVQPGVDFRPLLDGAADEVLPLDFLWNGSKPRRVREMLAFFRRGFDLVLCGSRMFFIPEALFSGTPKLLGVYSGGSWQEQIGQVVPRNLHRHEVDNNLQLVEILAGPVPAERRAPTVRLNREETARRGEQLERVLNVPPQAPLLLVHPGANRDSRRWPTEHLGQALEQLMSERPKLHVLLTGTLGEKELVRTVIERLPPNLRGRVRDLSGRTGIPDLIALLRRVSVALCNDTGILHLARALDTPLVVTSGPENHHLRGPYPIGRAPAIVLRREIPCAPCGRGSCTPHYCLRSLPPEKVATEVARLLDGNHPDRQVPEHTVLHDVAHLSWRQLGELGFSLPIVSVLLVGQPDETLDGAIDSMLDTVEPQTYPRIELIVAGQCSANWGDLRDERARRQLPLRYLPGKSTDWKDALRRAVQDSGGELITCFSRESAPWWRERLAADVAAWLREPEAEAYLNGVPGKNSGGLPELLQQTVAAGRLKKALALPQMAGQHSLASTKSLSK